MKKLKSLGVVAAATILLTSCLDGNNESSLNGFGVIDYSDDFRMVAYIDDYTPVYSPYSKIINRMIVFILLVLTVLMIQRIMVRINMQRFLML